MLDRREHNAREQLDRLVLPVLDVRTRPFLTTERMVDSALAEFYKLGCKPERKLVRPRRPQR